MQLWGLANIEGKGERVKGGGGGGGRRERERDPGGKEGMDGRGEEKGPGGKGGSPGMLHATTMFCLPHEFTPSTRQRPCEATLRTSKEDIEHTLNTSTTMQKN